MKTIEIIELGSLEEFLKEVVPVMGHRRIPIYRGTPESDHGIVPGLLRMAIGETEFSDWLALEAALMEKFKLRGGAELGFAPSSELEWQVSASHLGLPTRFTAWSENPLVALWFATAPSPEASPGVVWRLLPGDANLVATQDYQVDPESYHVYFPRHSDREILAQRCCFLSHPVPKLDTRPIPFEDSYEALEERDYSMHLARILIEPAEKKSIRARLSRLGVDERSLFPGLRGLASQLASEAYHHTGSYDWVL
jgi:hypothetical protein